MNSEVVAAFILGAVIAWVCARFACPGCKAANEEINHLRSVFLQDIDKDEEHIGM